MSVNSYEVGATFVLKDSASTTLQRLADQFNRLGGTLKGLQERLDKIAALKFTGIEEALQALDRRFIALGGRTDTFGKGLVDNLTRADAGLATTTAAVQRLGEQLSAARRQMGQMRLPGPGGPSGGGGGSHVRPTSSNTGGHGGGRHGPGVDLGMFGFMGAASLGHFVGHTIGEGMELAHLQEQMKQGGVSMQDIGRATAAARSEAEKYGLSIAKVLEDLKELQFPFGSMDHAIEFIDPLERMRIVLNSVGSGKGSEAADSVYKMARAGELKGLVEPKDYLSYFDAMTKTISATGGKVGPNDFMQFAKYGKLSTFGFDEEFFTKYAPTMIQTMGATTAGQSLQSLFSTVSGSVSQKSFYAMQDLGLIADPTKIVQTKTGIQMKPGAVEGYDEFTRNPLAWAKDVLRPLLEKKYGDLGVAANKEHAIGELQGLFGNRNSAAAVAELALRTKSFERDAGLIGKASGLEGVEQLLKQDPTAVMNRFTESWKNMLAALGQSSVQPALDGLNSLATGFGAIGKALAANPDLAKFLVGGLAGLAAGLAALAVVGFAAFLPGGLVVAGLTGLTGAIVGILAVNWDKLQGAANAVGGFFDRVRRMMGLVGADEDTVGPVGHPTVAPGLPLSGRAGQQLLNGLGMTPGLPGYPAGFSPIAYGGDDSPLVNAIASGFLKAFRELQGGGAANDNVRLGGAGGGIISAAYHTGMSAGIGATTATGSFLPSAPGSAAGLMESMRGQGGAQVNSFLHSHGQALDARVTAWCAGMLNATLDAAGIKGTGSLAAASFYHWGKHVSGQIQRGDVMVYPHHVGMLTGEVLPDGRVGMVSGNHGHRVGHSWVNPHGGEIRRAVPVPPRRGPDHPPINVHMDGKIVAQLVSRRQGMAGRFPTRVGGVDTHGGHINPGTPLFDVA